MEQLHEIISMHAFGIGSLAIRMGIWSSFCLLQSKVSGKGRTGIDICLPPDHSLVMDPFNMVGNVSDVGGQDSLLVKIAYIWPHQCFQHFVCTFCKQMSHLF